MAWRRTAREMAASGLRICVNRAGVATRAILRSIDNIAALPRLEDLR
jgi:hypothetical protein